MVERFKGFFDLHKGIRFVLFNIITSVGIFGGIVSLIVSGLAGMPMEQNVIIILAVIVLILSFYLANSRGLIGVASILICLLITDFLFPLMYFSGGGAYSGMPIWFVMGILFTFLLLEGKGFVLVLISEVVMTSVTLILGYLHPDWVTPIATEQGMCLDIWQSIMVIGIGIGIIIKFQTRNYDKLLRENEEKNEQLKYAIREAEEAQQQALDTSQAKSSFLANMSHEIRTPINAILGMDELLLREDLDDGIREYGENIQAAGQSLLSIVNDILDFSRIESGRLEIIPVEYGLASLIFDSYNMISLKARDKGLKMNMEFGDYLPSKLYGDEIRIRQVMINILNNAVKYTMEGSVTTRVTWDDKDGMLVIAVSDTGIGIARENIDKLFLSFSRVDEKRNRNIEGTGLGLTITKQMVELMGGTIEVESEYGKGSVFTLYIPQKIVDAENISGSIEQYRTTQHGEGYRTSFVTNGAQILAVDDVAMNLKVVKGLLAKTGIEIDVAFSGEECIERVSEKKYDLILMDHMMPRMDGIETLEKLKSEYADRLLDTPVIMLSANAIQGVREQYLASGFVDYLSKPVRGEALEKCIIKNINPEKITITIDADRSVVDPLGAMAGNEAEKESVSEEAVSVIDRICRLIPELDVEAGLEFCGGEEAFLEEMLREYAFSDRAAIIDEAYALVVGSGGKNLSDYQVQVHALKSSSATIGLMELSEQAKTLEMAAKNGDGEYVLKHNGETMAYYDKVVTIIRMVFGSEG